MAAPPSAVLRRMDSLAFLASSLARLAVRALSKIIRPTWGFSSRKVSSFSETMLFTSVRISLLPSLALVWPSNCASVSFTEMTQVRPSRQSSPETFSSSFSILIFRP